MVKSRDQTLKSLRSYISNAAGDGEIGSIQVRMEIIYVEWQQQSCVR